MKNILAGMLLLGIWRAGGADILPQGPWGFYAEHHNATLSQTGGVLRFEVRQRSDPFYLTQVSQPLTQSLSVGHKIKFSFEARATRGNAIRALVEQNGEPYFAVVSISPALGADWKTFRTFNVTERDWPAGSLGLRFQVGQDAGVIEIRNIKLEDAGDDPCIAAAKAALAPEKIEARIREHRMADLQIEVCDAAGRRVPGVSVRIEQQRHAFLFGCNIFELRPDDTSPQQRAYQEKYVALLNYATLPFYWGTFETQRGQPQYERLGKMARWCQAHSITCKGHPLIWHMTWPTWAPNDAETAVPLLRNRVFDLIPRYRDTIHFWDVVNEANVARHFPRTGEGQWIKRDGPATVVATALGWAREANRQGGARLLYNDFNVGTENVALLQGLRERNALPDAIGIQSHMHGGVWPLSQAWDVVERFAVFGRPVHFTEMTIVSGPEPKHPHGQEWVPNWITTPAGEAAQARYVAELYTVLFSHPAMRAITWWDFSDHHAWKGAPAGLLRKDMAPKPVYGELLKLIREKWWTRATVSTGSDGTTTIRVFRGLHKVIVTDSAGRVVSQAVEIPAEGIAPKVTVTLP